MHLHIYIYICENREKKQKTKKRWLETGSKLKLKPSNPLHSRQGIVARLNRSSVWAAWLVTWPARNGGQPFLVICCTHPNNFSVKLDTGEFKSEQKGAAGPPHLVLNLLPLASSTLTHIQLALDPGFAFAGIDSYSGAWAVPLVGRWEPSVGRWEQWMGRKGR